MVFDDLKWRGLIAQTSSDDLVKLLRSPSGKDQPLVFYCGFDPTAPSLHHGNLVQLILMRHLQLAGHKPIAVVGGGTGLIGDPKEQGDRVLNPKETVEQWAEKLKTTFAKILDFSPDLPNRAEVVNNYEWLGKLSAIEVLRDIGKNFRLGNMLAKETVARRLKSEDGISYTEFSYQVLQGYDFLHLYQNYGVTLQTGGNDQWGNLTAGIDLVHKVCAKQVYAMTTPLITKADGSKFGKSEGGDTVWLDAQMMSPYQFYQFWFNTADDDVINLLKIFTFKSKEEIEQIESEFLANPGGRLAQKELAYDITSLIHGVDTVEDIIKASNALFGRGELNEISESVLSDCLAQLQGVTGKIGDNLFDLFVASGLEQGKNATRRSFNEGGLYLNNQRLTAEGQMLEQSDLLAGKYALLRKGKKNMRVVQL